MVEGEGLNLRRPKSTGLQPAPFDRFGTPPWFFVYIILTNLYIIFLIKSNENKYFWVGGKNTVIEIIKNKKILLKKYSA